MLEALKALNPNIPMYSVLSEEFKPFGRVITTLDPKEIIEVAKTIPNPESGSSYEPKTAKFENLAFAREMEAECYGCLPSQVGYCWGHNTLLNGAEWHFGNEVNVAVTPLVLLVAHRGEIVNGKIDSSAFRGFYLPAGTVCEVYASTLHFCPCEVSKDGFGCVVGLPEGTNVPLEQKTNDPLLFRKSKWLIAHEKNEGLLAKGVVSGITGENLEVHYPA